MEIVCLTSNYNDLLVSLSSLQRNSRAELTVAAAQGMEQDVLEWKVAAAVADEELATMGDGMGSFSR